MSDTELWIEQARTYLKQARRETRGSLGEPLQAHMARLDLARVQADLGCGDDCAECSWGFLGGQHLGSEPCRVLALQQAVEELQRRDADDASARAEAARLLEILDRLPSRRP